MRLVAYPWSPRGSRDSRTSPARASASPPTAPAALPSGPSAAPGPGRVGCHGRADRRCSDPVPQSPSRRLRCPPGSETRPCRLLRRGRLDGDRRHACLSQYGPIDCSHAVIARRLADHLGSHADGRGEPTHRARIGRLGEAIEILVAQAARARLLGGGTTRTSHTKRSRGPSDADGPGRQRGFCWSDPRTHRLTQYGDNRPGFLAPSSATWGACR